MPMTICTLRRVLARPALTRRRISSSSRAEPASEVSTSRRPGPRSWELSISAATIRSALESSRSSANCCRAVESGVRTRSRSDRAISWGRIEGAAAVVVAGIACSRPTAPAIVSRSDSVHAASPSSRAIPTRSERAPPNSEGAKNTSTPVAPASTTHRVSSRIARPARTANGTRAPRLFSRGHRDDGSTALSPTSTACSDMISRAIPPPITAPSRTISSWLPVM